ncbi:LytS/YhcK type 5TM receptor domain-containing protein [Pelosinus fermentans]|uniref:histidine kinase n=1 Tax=Pelosinus fermentans JBW45 TaxID=1192197 RepID=I9DAR5_9FIRM|nr:LytS/YhcK type 5TM receptor domain-containing protein [Pelosinus fermentans]AJQ29065.1 multi-sensor signal transduction histidine kinase [Pelosinus fermentans JBW45]
MNEDLINVIISPINNVCVIIVMAYVLSHRKYYWEIVEGKRNTKNEVLFTLTFGIFSLYGAIAGGIANVRVLGPMLAGLLGGPIIGVGAGLFSGGYRLYDLRYGAAEVTNSAVLITLLAGLAGGFVHRWKKGQLPGVCEAAVFAASFEIFHMILTLMMGQWSDGVIDIVKRFAIPMTVAHTVGAAIFVFVTKNVIHARRNQAEKDSAQRELQKSEERFATAFNFNPSPMSIRSIEDGRYITVNESFLRTFEYTREEIIGKTLRNLHILIDDYDEIVQLLRKGKSISNFETHIYTKTGKLQISLLFCELIDIGGKPHTLSVFIDIGEMKKLENEVLRLERLNLAGHMSTGIAHEIRNPLTTIRGFMQFLSAKKDLSHCKEYFDLTIQELDQINSIMSELILLARTKSVNFERTNLNALISALLPLIKTDEAAINKDVDVDLGDIPDLLMDKKEMMQLILNLAKNGIESMEDYGILKISTYVDKGEVVLSVQDRGKGMNAEMLKKIGTPFFSTKDTGTGLGLAICYSIAERHRAVIAIESSSKGTTFLVKFKISIESSEVIADNNVATRMMG